jgi:hypothetical protein
MEFQYYFSSSALSLPSQEQIAVESCRRPPLEKDCRWRLAFEELERSGDRGYPVPVEAFVRWYMGQAKSRRVVRVDVMVTGIEERRAQLAN